ncbi:long-chain fatty acid--CoA ligase [Rhodomicrobium udaipurense JA643]|uniref:Long-chain fatty acid--CoA ligase n=1 Tax=Rhodomicrobium udaipurense TaxID=1202716 RepID=A0A8I1KIU7_9HYPH|nr:long-chain fatty acid--CoA ligase [Rhodomicrobium udaipurense]KAI94559.1 long-chain fatty acid--CoA ligase [Rhodomicrobium udaipurense JA643]MBJ7545080.1 long-chain fatty acid--CoA ligase [Rhodomicrobium udaipurense]
MGRQGPAPLEDEPFVSPPRRFLETAARRGTAPAYYVREAEGWTATPWNVFRDEVRRAARALVALGVKPGDAVGVIGYNRPEWVIMDIAAMMVGANVAGIYFTASAQDAAYIIAHSECAVVLAEKEEHFRRIVSQREELSHLRHVVMMRGADAADPLQMTWDAFMAQGDDRFDAEIERRLQAIQPKDVGCLIYTSGTTGPPKAVQISHDALAKTAALVLKLFDVTGDDRTISYLPLAHIAERILTIHFQITVGNAVYFARDVLSLGEHLPEVRPDFFFGVPRVYEKLASAVQAKLASAKGPKAKIVHWALGVGQDWHRKEQAGERIGLKTALAMAVASRLFHRKAKRLIGLDRAKHLGVGAAPIPEETLRFLTGLDLPVRELWGLSESAGVGTTNLKGATKIGSVGKPYPGLDLKIDRDGEILIRGPYMFIGYAKDPEATARTFTDGWLRTGDLGHVDLDGYVHITGRKKDIIITSGGKNVAPANLEMELVALPLVEHAIVCGERRPYLGALITLDKAAAERFASERGMADGPALTEAIREEIQEGIHAINARHSRVENIRRFAILPEPLSIENGDLTPTLKVKRQAVMTRLTPVVDGLYRENEKV